MFMQYYDWDGMLCRLCQREEGGFYAEIWIDGKGYQPLPVQALAEADPLSRPEAAEWLAQRERMPAS